MTIRESVAFLCGAALMGLLILAFKESPEETTQHVTELNSVTISGDLVVSKWSDSVIVNNCFIGGRIMFEEDEP